MYLKLTVTATGFFKLPPHDNTAKCLLELYDDNDMVISSYVVGVRKSIEDMKDNLRTQPERVRKFKNFLEKEATHFSIGFNHETLYKYGVTKKEFDDFIDNFENKWGVNQSQGYNFLFNNCSVAVESVIDHFFPNETTAQYVYTALKYSPYILSACTLSIMPCLLVMASIVSKPGFNLPTVHPSPSNPLIKAKLMSFFSRQQPIEEQAADLYFAYREGRLTSSDLILFK